METIQKWIAEKTFNNPDCRNRQIEIGGLDLSLLLRHDVPGITNPLQITLRSDQHAPKQAVFSIPVKDGSATVLGSIKKIAGTPFYHSCLSSPYFIADIIDFYDWTKDLILYRMFIIHL